MQKSAGGTCRMQVVEIERKHGDEIKRIG